MLNQKRPSANSQVSRTILGIDPGTGRLGWAVIQKGARTPILIDCGCIATPANTPLVDRLEIIYKEISLVIKKYQPQEMAVEELFFVKNIKTGISVAHARGVILLAGKQNNLEIFDYKPNEIKLSICGDGHASKEQIAKMLKYYLKGCIIKQDDTADAVAIALCHLQNNRRLT